MAKKAPIRVGVREFKQKRSARTYQSLLEAAARVFSLRGYDGAQTPEIATEAGVSTGAFYRYFVDKREIFLEVVDRHLAVALEEVSAELRPERFDGMVDRGVIALGLDVVFERVRRDIDLLGVIFSMSLRDPEVARRRADLEAGAREVLVPLLERLVPPELIAQPRVAAEVIVVAVIEVALDAAGLRPRVGKRPSSTELKKALLDMIFRYAFPGSPITQPRAPSTRAAQGRSPGKTTRSPRGSRRAG